MYYTPSDLRERHVYVERSIEAARQDLADPHVVRHLGNNAALFTSMLDSLEIVDIHDAEIQLPTNKAALPVVAIRRDETIVMAHKYQLQERVQRHNALKTIRSWGPRFDDIEDWYDDLAGNVSMASRPEIRFHENTASRVGHSASILSQSDLERHFNNGPAKSIGLIFGRPCLMLGMQPDQRSVTADTFIHEFTHIKQYRLRPVITLRSQRSADMYALRDELEAYHMGFISSIKAHDRLGNNVPSESLVQIVVEDARRRFGIDQLDPYRPSPALLAVIHESLHNKANILHGSIDFEAVRDMIENYQSGKHLSFSEISSFAD